MMRIWGQWQGLTWVSLGLACLAAGCTLRPAGFGPNSAENPPMFRDLAALPEKPPVLPADEAERAVQSLTADRATAAAAADGLRREPFTVPDPPPPKVDF